MTILGNWKHKQGHNKVIKAGSPSPKRKGVRRPFRGRLMTLFNRGTLLESKILRREKSKKLRVSRATMGVMKREVLNLLACSCSVSAMAGSLAGSHIVSESYSMEPVHEDEIRRPMDHLSKDFTALSFLRRQKNDARVMRRYELVTALNDLEKDPKNKNTVISSWLEALEALSRVFEFPQEEEDEADSELTIGKQAKGIDSETGDGVNTYLRLVDGVDRKERYEKLQPSSTKWKQVAYHPLPPTLAERDSNDTLAPNSIMGRRAASSSLTLSDQAFIFDLSNHMVSHAARIQSKEVAETEARLKEKERAEEAERKASLLMRPLTGEEEQIVHKAMYDIGPTNEVVAQVGPDSVQRGSMHTLQPGTWLNDEVIHYFYVMLSKRDEEMCQRDPKRKRSHFFKSFFMTKLLNEGNADPSMDGRYEYRQVKRWSKKVPGKDIFALDKIFFPINEQRMHWLCAVVYMTEKRIQVYDSMGSGSHYLESLFQYLKDEHMDKKKSPLPDAEQWSLIPCQDDTPRQRNGE